MSFPALKEWSVIVEALGAGEQNILLRKGGLAEPRGGFRVGSDRFWLFPTFFHAQREKTKPAASRWFDSAASPAAASPSIELRYFADVVNSVFLSDWRSVASLDPFHFWTEVTVRERFEWSRPPGVHVLILRIHKLVTPLVFPLTADMGGCKSWLNLPPAFDAQPSLPVLDDTTARSRLAALPL